MAEMYSAFKAEVPVPGDPSTGGCVGRGEAMMVGHGLVMVSRAHVRFIPSTEMNMALVEKLKAEPCVRVCGQVGRGGLE